MGQPQQENTARRFSLNSTIDSSPTSYSDPTAWSRGSWDKDSRPQCIKCGERHSDGDICDDCRGGRLPCGCIGECDPYAHDAPWDWDGRPDAVEYISEEAFQTELRRWGK
jgi:hypothetical protein